MFLTLRHIGVAKVFPKLVVVVSAKNFATDKRTKTDDTQPKLNVACFVVQFCLADADFVISSNYCLIGTPGMRILFCISIFVQPRGQSAGVGQSLLVPVGGDVVGVQAGNGMLLVPLGVEELEKYPDVVGGAGLVVAAAGG